MGRFGAGMRGFIKLPRANPRGDGAEPGKRSHDFLPSYLRMQEAPPSPLPRTVLYVLTALFVGLLLWALLGKLDIIATAQGKLVPSGYLKVLQPAESGIVREIVVKEGQLVKEGDVLVRLDSSIGDADLRATTADLGARTLQLRRIDAEIAGNPFPQIPEDDPQLYIQAYAQFLANGKLLRDAIALELANVKRTMSEMKGAQEVLSKLERTVPLYQSTHELCRP